MYLSVFLCLCLSVCLFICLCVFLSVLFCLCGYPIFVFQSLAALDSVPKSPAASADSDACRGSAVVNPVSMDGGLIDGV